jgi:hypothetical protein
LLPCGHPPACWNADTRTLLLPVSPTHALSRSCLVPRDSYRLPFTHRSTLLVALDPDDGTHPVPLASPTSKPCSSCESVCIDSSCPKPTHRSSLGFLPL